MGIFLLVWLIWKDWILGLFCGYVFFIVSVTILSRKQFDGTHYQPELFWSYRFPQLREQILMNVIAYIPVGVIGARLWGWKIVPIAIFLSVCIETVQMITRCGLFEFDDIVHNGLGAVIGVLVYMLITHLVRCWNRSRYRWGRGME